MALRRMLVSARRIRAPRKTERSDVLWDERLADLFKDKHTPCIKTNRLKRQNRSRAERAVRATPLGESGPFFSHIGNAIFCPLFHRRIFFFLYQVAKFAFVFSASKSPLGFTLICVFPFKLPLNIYFFNKNFP